MNRRDSACFICGGNHFARDCPEGGSNKCGGKKGGGKGKYVDSFISGGGHFARGMDLRFTKIADITEDSTDICLLVSCVALLGRSDQHLYKGWEFEVGDDTGSITLLLIQDLPLIGRLGNALEYCFRTDDLFDFFLDSEMPAPIVIELPLVIRTAFSLLRGKRLLLVVHADSVDFPSQRIMGENRCRFQVQKGSCSGSYVIDVNTARNMSACIHAVDDIEIRFTDARKTQSDGVSFTTKAPRSIFAPELRRIVQAEWGITVRSSSART